ncbi:MAG: choice-of-anchor J domain-containing protein [Marinicella sp.]
MKILIVRSLTIVTLFSCTAVANEFANAKPLSSRSDQTHITTSQVQHMTRSAERRVLFFEDFSGEIIPSDWVLDDVDGLTPFIDVSYFTDAWIAVMFEDNWVAASTSWYDPPGQSDDWLITPLISIEDNSLLTWRAMTLLPNFPDGYEVYISTTTQDVQGCMEKKPVFSIEQESTTFETRDIHLLSEGYSDQDIYVCFRNNSNDKYILIFDDIEVSNNDAVDDLTISAVTAPSEYSLIPTIIGYEQPLTVYASNLGIRDQNNVWASAKIYKNGNLYDHIGMIFPEPIIAGARDVPITIGTFSTQALGVYDINYSIQLHGDDENPSDNEASVLSMTEVTAETMARNDDKSVTNYVGIGGQSGGYLGVMYEFSENTKVSEVQIVNNNNECDEISCSLDGQTIWVDVFKINEETGLPEEHQIASTDEYVVPSGPFENNVVNFVFQNYLNLSPGKYVFALKEPVVEPPSTYTGNIQLHFSSSRFTLGAGWVIWPSIPNGNWANVEDFDTGLGPVVFHIRPKFVELSTIFKSGFDN